MMLALECGSLLPLWYSRQLAGGDWAAPTLLRQGKPGQQQAALVEDERVRKREQPALQKTVNGRKFPE